MRAKAYGSVLFSASNLNLTTAHIYCACASFPEEFSAPRLVVPYFNRPVLSHMHGSFASMDVYGLLEIHSYQEC